MRFLLIALLSATLAGCGVWVELTPAAEKVQVRNPGEIGGCEKIAQTTASVADNVGGFKRRDDIVQVNLQKLARNKAAELHGNVVVPASAVQDGNQTFDVYRCPM